MKKQFIIPEIEVLKFKSEDVILTDSGDIDIGGGNDGFWDQLTQNLSDFLG